MAGRRYLWLAACVLALLLVVAACGGGDATPTAPQRATPTLQPTPTTAPTAVPATPTPAGPVPKTGGVLKAREIGLSFRSWDTYAPIGAFSTLYVQDMLSNLVVSDRVNKTLILPDAAERWDVSADGKVYTFRLRENVVWHDGKPFTSADVAYSLTRAWKPSAPTLAFNRGKMKFVEAIDAPDASTVRVTLKQPSASFLIGVATPFMLMYPAHIPDLQAWQAKPVGTGPFAFKEFKSGSNIDLVKNERYYKKDDAGRQLPYLDGVSFFVIPDPAQGLASFRTQRIDCGCGFDNDFLTNNKASLEREISGLKLLIAGGDSFDLFFRNKAPWTNVALRKAISVAIDRKELRSLYRQGLGHYPPTIFLTQDLGGKWSVPTSELLTLPGFREPKSVDVDLANQLFAQAGVRPRDVVVSVIIASFFADFGEALQAVLAKTGVSANLRILAGAEHSSATSTGDFDIALKNGGQSWDDPADIYIENFTTGGVTNYGRWSDPEVDRLAEAQDKELDPAKRQKLTQELSRRLIDEALYVPIANSPNATGTQPHISGFVVGPFTVGSHLRHELLWFNNR